MFAYKKAFEIAEKYRLMLAPHCELIEIAGSIRREVLTVKDIELICVPKKMRVPNGMFETKFEPVQEFVNMVNSWERVKGDPQGKYCQRILPEGIKLDLFIVEPQSWGFQMAIRTGPAGFSQWLVTQGKKRGFTFKDGVVYGSSGRAREVRYEKDFFKMIGVEYVEPQFRINVKSYNHNLERIAS